jgi:hypothetical protein
MGYFPLRYTCIVAHAKPKCFATKHQPTKNPVYFLSIAVVFFCGSFFAGCCCFQVVFFTKNIDENKVGGAQTFLFGNIGKHNNKGNVKNVVAIGIQVFHLYLAVLVDVEVDEC